MAGHKLFEPDDTTNVNVSDWARDCKKDKNNYCKNWIGIKWDPMDLNKAVENTRYPLMKRCTSTLLFPKMNDFPQISIYEVQRSLYNRKLRFLAQWGDIISKVPCIISCPLIFIRFFFSIWQV